MRALVKHHTYAKPIFEWYMVRFAVKNEHQTSMYYDEIGLCAHNTLYVMGSSINTIERAYVIFKEKEESSL
jgi:hypothetical protein